MGLFTKSQVAGAVTDVIVNRIQDAIVKAISTLEDRVRSLLEPAVAVVTGSFTMTDENVVEYVGNSSASKITLPPAASIPGRRSRPRVVLHNGTKAMTLAAGAGGTLNGGASILLFPQDIAVVVANGSASWSCTLPRSTADPSALQGGHEEVVNFIAAADSSTGSTAKSIDYTINFAGRSLPSPINGLRIQATETNLGTGSPVHKPLTVFVNNVEKFFVDNSGAIGSGLAQIANGGGAAPTLGTIGGSGPAAAAQSGWMKVTIGGNTRFIPVWA